MNVPLLPVEKLLTGCPTCSYQNGGNPGAEFFLYMMLAMPWIIMGVVGYYFWTKRFRENTEDLSSQPAEPPCTPAAPPTATTPQ